MIFCNIKRCINIFVNFTTTFYQGLNIIILVMKLNIQNN